MNENHIALVRTLSTNKNISFSELCEGMSQAGLTDVEIMAAIRGADAEDRIIARATASTRVVREMRIV